MLSTCILHFSRDDSNLDNVVGRYVLEVIFNHSWNLGVVLKTSASGSKGRRTSCSFMNSSKGDIWRYYHVPEIDSVSNTLSLQTSKEFFEWCTLLGSFFY